jgi:hypothetical protein
MLQVKDIPLPDGYIRISSIKGSFHEYLQNLPLRKDKTIYLYDGQPKKNQSLHYAVVNISTGKKDLQQCADAIMRIRAEYYYARGEYDSICFKKSSRNSYLFSKYLKSHSSDTRNCFMDFMQEVFINCGTFTLQDQLKKVPDLFLMQIGDVFVKGGAPGHAEIVVDLAIEPKTGKKIFLLAEGYMPAQDIHILINPVNIALGPWYELSNNNIIVTSSWVFQRDQLRRW